MHQHTVFLQSGKIILPCHISQGYCQLGWIHDLKFQSMYTCTLNMLGCSWIVIKFTSNSIFLLSCESKQEARCGISTITTAWFESAKEVLIEGHNTWNFISFYLIQRLLYVDCIVPGMSVPQNFPISTDSLELPSLISMKSYILLPWHFAPAGFMSRWKLWTWREMYVADCWEIL